MGEAMPVLSMSAADLAFLKECAAAAYPLECCGLLVGCLEAAPGVCVAGGLAVSRVVPTANRAPLPQRSFEVDPAAHIALLRALRDPSGKAGPHRQQIIGHYHSHPDAPAVPSARDLAQAMEADAVWLIVAANRAGAFDVRAWQAVRDDKGVMSFRAMDLISR